MKSRLFQLTCLSLCLLISARLFAEDAPSSLSPDQPERTAPRPPEQLDQLFGPIALYPDALIALILPAATVPSDVVLAARYLAGNGDPAKADDESWDDSVKALVHYPDIVKWMDENLAWAKQAGDAFATQPADVMNSIQRLRARARAAGALVDTPQQQVVMEDNNISIIPAQPDVIYVPSYDPDVVYVSRPGFYSDPFLTFGVGYATGFWLGYDFDWGRRRIWTIDRRDRERYWSEHRDWRRPSFPGRPGYKDEHFHEQPWNPRPNYQRPRSPVNNPRAEVVRPVPFPNGGPNRPSDPRRGGPEVNSFDHDRDRGRGSPRDHDAPPNRRPDNNAPVPPPRTIVAPSSTPPAPSSPAPSNERVQTVTQPPSQGHRDREDHESNGRERRDAAPNGVVPPGRAAPAEPPSRGQVPAVHLRPEQRVPSQQARPAPPSPPAKVDRDDKQDKPPRQ